MTGVDRYVSSDGRRILLVNHDTGEVWLSRSLSACEVADIEAALPNWKLLRPRAPQLCDICGRSVRGSRLRRQAQPALRVMTSDE